MKSLDTMTAVEVAQAIDATCKARGLNSTSMPDRQRALQHLQNQQGQAPPDEPVTIINAGEILNEIRDPALRASLAEHAAAARNPLARLCFEERAFAAIGRTTQSAKSFEECLHSIARRDGLDLRRREDFAMAARVVAEQRPDLCDTYRSAPRANVSTPLVFSEPSSRTDAEAEREAKDLADDQFLLRLDEAHARACSERGLFPGADPKTDAEIFRLRQRIAEALLAEQRR
jgi:hypothetical protein